MSWSPAKCINNVLSCAWHFLTPIVRCVMSNAYPPAKSSSKNAAYPSAWATKAVNVSNTRTSSYHNKNVRKSVVILSLIIRSTKKRLWNVWRRMILSQRKSKSSKNRCKMMYSQSLGRWLLDFWSFWAWGSVVVAVAEIIDWLMRKYKLWTWF